KFFEALAKELIAYARAVYTKDRKGELPEFPQELGFVWEQFCKLSGRRQAGMAANPLTYSELEAFERKALIRFSAWETGLIMRLDDEVLAVWRDSVANPASHKPNEPEATDIPVEDTEGLRVMFKARAAQRRLQAEAAARV